MPAWFRRLRARLRYRRFDADLRQELEAHRAMLEADLQRQGRSPLEACGEAARTLGNATLQREHARAIWLTPWLDALRQDVRYAVRSLGRSPAFTVTILITMVIGIVLNTVQFSAFNTVLLKPWPVEHADDLVHLGIQGSDGYKRFQFTLANVEDFETHSRALAAVGASSMGLARASGNRASPGSLTYLSYVTPGFFDATGVRFQMGRNFRPHEDRDRAPERVVILSHNLWQREFAGAADVLGRELHLAYGRSGPFAYTVIGVTRPGWSGGLPYRDDAWLPLQTMADLQPENPIFSVQGERCCVSLVARLAPGTSPSQVRAELTGLLRQRATEPADLTQRVVVSGTAMISAPDRSGVLALAMLAVAIGTIAVLLLVGANVAHLHLARAMSRQKEIQTRLALGAGRGRVVRQLVTEGLVLSVVAGVISLVVVYNLTGVLMRLSEISSPEAWAPDAKVFLYCFGVAALTSIVFGLTPALRMTKVSLIQGAGPAATPPSRLRFNTALLSFQIALSTVALTGAGLATRSLINATSADHLGYSAEGVTVAMVERSDRLPGVTPGAWMQALQQAFAASRLPPAAFVDIQPLTGHRPVSIRRPDQSVNQARTADIAPVSASTFALLGIPFVEGRPASDRPDAAEAVVNQALVRLLWPGQQVLGQRLVVKLRPGDEGAVFTVVGVTREVLYATEESKSPTLHVAPATMSTSPAILVRAAGPAIAEQISRIVRGLDPQAKVGTRPLTDNVEQRLKDFRVGAALAGAGGFLALALAAFGLFGVFAFVVEARRREIGIRIALGAQKMHVLRMLFGATRLATLCGLGGGLLLSLGIGPLMGTYLYGLHPFDPIAFAGVAAILAVTGALATLLPAWRALSVDPAVTLRQDT